MKTLDGYAYDVTHADDLEAGLVDTVMDVATGGASAAVRAAGGTVADKPTASAGERGLSAGSMTGAVQQGIVQGTGGPLSQSPLGSMVGLGLGGALPGAGWLPDPMAMHAAHLFGQPYLPPAAQALSMLGGGRAERSYDELAAKAQLVGQEVVRQVLGVTEPQLKKLQEAFSRQQLSRDATAEHRTIQGRDAFRRRVLALLQQIVAQNRARGVAPSLSRFNVVVPSAQGRAMVASYSLPAWRP